MPDNPIALQNQNGNLIERVLRISNAINAIGKWSGKLRPPNGGGKTNKQLTYLTAS